MKLGPIRIVLRFDCAAFFVSIRNKYTLLLMHLDYVVPGGNGGHGHEPSVRVTSWVLSKHKPGGLRIWERTIWKRRKSL